LKIDEAIAEVPVLNHGTGEISSVTRELADKADLIWSFDAHRTGTRELHMPLLGEENAFRRPPPTQ